MSCSLGALGLVTTLGDDLASSWQALRAGEVTTLRSRSHLVPGEALLVGDVVADLEPCPETLARHACRNNLLSLRALRQMEGAVHEALRGVRADRVGVVMGSSTAGMSSAEAAVAARQRSDALPPEFDYSQMELGGVAEFVADWLGVSGPCYTISTACSSGARALASARSLLTMDLCDVVIAGGTDSLCATTANGFAALKALTDRPSLPFSQNRSGFTLGEGSAIFLVTRNGGGVQLAGVGESSDAHHMSAPQPDGIGAEAAMRAALHDAGIPPDAIQYINLHGTGTALNDVVEGKAVHRVFGDRIVCSSTKPLLGHTLGASGAIEAAVCWLTLRAIQDETLAVPPHHWDEVRDPQIPTLRLARRGDVVPVEGSRAYVMSNSFGFGGNNCALVLATAGT